MPYQFPPDLDVRVKAFLKNGRFQTEDDVLREALDSLEREEQEVVSSIQRSMREFEAGDFQTLDEVDSEIRKELGFQSPQ